MARQAADGLAQGIADEIGCTAVGQVDQHQIAGASLDEGADGRAAVLADGQVAFPVARDGPAGGLGRRSLIMSMGSLG